MEGKGEKEQGKMKGEAHGEVARAAEAASAETAGCHPNPVQV